MAYHFSRSFPGTGTPLEDACPCPQEPCGHISSDRIVEGCPQHDLRACKTMRSIHTDETCPSLVESSS